MKPKHSYLAAAVDEVTKEYSTELTRRMREVVREWKHSARRGLWPRFGDMGVAGSAECMFVVKVHEFPTVIFPGAIEPMPVNPMGTITWGEE